LRSSQVRLKVFFVEPLHTFVIKLKVDDNCFCSPAAPQTCHGTLLCEEEAFYRPLLPALELCTFEAVQKSRYTTHDLN